MRTPKVLDPHNKDVRELLLAYRYRWSLHRRPEQWADDKDDWTYWFFCAGRGAGKTRSGAEKVREWAEKGVYQEIALIAPTHDDVEKVMLNGPAGIMRICPPWYRPTFNARSRILQWPDRITTDADGRIISRRDGMRAYCYSAEKPEKFRGPQFQAAWADEICAWRFPLAWELLAFGIRLPPRPRVIITSTPKPIPVIREIMDYKGLYVTSGTTYDNVANLSGVFFDTIIKRFEGTRLGRQELLAELLSDNPHALWKSSLIERSRLVCGEKELPEFDDVVIAVDPNASESENADDCGIIVCASRWDGNTTHYYTLEDATMVQPTPEEWGQEVVRVFKRWRAHRVVFEGNKGGNMGKSIIHNVDNDVPVKIVYAMTGKTRRAEPIAQLSEQGRDHHWGLFPELESEMLDWNPKMPQEQQESPDRMDAKVWGYTDLMEHCELQQGVI